MPTADGDMPAFLWTPASGTGPGVLLLQEIFGVSPYIQRRAPTSPQPATSSSPPSSTGGSSGSRWTRPPRTPSTRRWPWRGRLEWPLAVTDAVAAFQRLAGLEPVRGTPALLGFCLGGGLAFNVAAETEPAALVSYYGSVAARPARPGSAGDLPEPPPLRDRRRLPPRRGGPRRDRAPSPPTAAPPRVETYEGANHAFDNDDFPLHHPEASRQAWETTLGFLREQLPA